MCFVDILVEKWAGLAAVKHPPGSHDKTVNSAQILRLGPHPQGTFIPKEDRAHSMFHLEGTVTERFASGVLAFLNLPCLS